MKSHVLVKRLPALHPVSNNAELEHLYPPGSVAHGVELIQCGGIPCVAFTWLQPDAADLDVGDE